ncbi:MAG: hypothetical protein K2H37_12165 [Lachnospiraceae bacterium]|nr:hypothetical protein [Lachnospiraceae bacterium]
MSKRASNFQKKVMSLSYRGKEIFKPLNTGWIDDIKIEAFLVPGHTWGHMVYLVDDAYLFTGDAIWFGADGGYSFINSLAEDNDLAKRSLAALEKKLRGRGLFPKVITGHTGWSEDLDFVFAHKDQVCNSMKKQTPHDLSAPYDGYDERDDTEDKARRTKLASADSRRKVLVFGAGVIGSYLAHVLCEAGNEVTILAREARAVSLNRNGLVIRHHLQGKVTKDRVEAVTSVEGRTFDAAFVVMPYHKLKAALLEIDRLQANLLVLVGNDVTPAEIEKHIKENAPGVKKILFGFQATGGKKEENRYICERLGGGMAIGQLHDETAPKLKKWAQRLFEGTDYKLNWQGDMESYLICHVAAILPIGYLSYICDGNLRKSTGRQRRMMLEASHEAYEFLKGKGMTIYPVNDDKYFEKGVRGWLMAFLYFVMAKTKIGDMVACEHCRNAVSEMEQLDLFYEKLMEGYPVEKRKTWQKLHAQMPSWEELHRTYGN